MPNTARLCLRGSWSRIRSLNYAGRSLLLLLASLVLTGCCSSIVTVPRLPEPAADLMQSVPTGSEYLESVSAELKASQADLRRWETTLRDGLTN